MPTLVSIQQGGTGANSAAEAINALGVVANTGGLITGNLNVTATLITQNVIPDANITYDLGSSTARFKDLWLSNSTIYLGEASISAEAGNVSFGNATIQLSNVTSKLNVTNDLFVSGNVGIGTSSTSNSIQINAVSPSIRLEETDSGGSKRLELSVANNGVARISADQSSQEIAFSTVGTERVRIGSNGAVLVGTTSDPTGSTTQHFFSHSGNNATAFIVGDAVNNSSISGIYIRSLDPRLVRPTNIPISIADTSGNKHVVVAGNGDVGIGTTSPTGKLTIRGSNIGGTGSSVNPSNSSIVLEYAGGPQSGDYGAALSFSQYWWTNSTALIGVGQIAGIKTTANGNFGGGLAFMHVPEGSSTFAEGFRLTHQGRVGIGTQTPEGRIDIHGGDLVLDAFNVGDERGIFFRRGFVEANKYNVSILVKDHNGNFSDGLSINGYDGISFCTGSNSRNERMRIDINGNVGIGTTSPGAQLDVWGPDSSGGQIRLVTKTNNTANFQTIASIRNTGSTVNDAIFQLFDNGTARISMAANAARGGDAYFNTGGNVLFGCTSTPSGSVSGLQINAAGNSPFLITGATITSQVDHMRFFNPNGQVGALFTNGSTFSLYSASDVRRKKDIQEADDAGKIVDAIRVVKHNWKGSDEHTRYGFIAQELINVYPEAVKKGDDSEEVQNIWGVSKEILVPLLVKEIQSLRQRVTALEEK